MTAFVHRIRRIGRKFLQRFDRSRRRRRRQRRQYDVRRGHRARRRRGLSRSERFVTGGRLRRRRQSYRRRIRKRHDRRRFPRRIRRRSQPRRQRCRRRRMSRRGRNRQHMVEPRYLGRCGIVVRHFLNERNLCPWRRGRRRYVLGYRRGRNYLTGQLRQRRRRRRPERIRGIRRIRNRHRPIPDALMETAPLGAVFFSSSFRTPRRKRLRRTGIRTAPPRLSAQPRRRT